MNHNKCVYLDNAATTATSESVIEIMNKVMREDYGNPSSMHQKGVDAENYIKDARQIIAKTLKVEPKEIVFTSGGTEANNTALIGAAFANKRAGMHLITTVMEHASVYNPMIYLEECGFEITYINVDSMGHICMEELKNAIREDTILVSVMMVNNEVGALNDIKAISDTIKEINPKTLLHVDAIQGFGKYKILPKKMGIDLLSVSGHKFHGPKGSGFLYIKDRVKVKPFIHGGGQESGMRSGTENVPAIAGLGQAVKDIYENHDVVMDNLYELKGYFVYNVLKLNEELSIDNISVNAVNVGDLTLEAVTEAVKETAPHVVSVSFKNIRSEVMLHALEERGVYVSSGSACSSNHPSISGTLKAIGVKKELLDSTIRFSFSKNTTKEELDYALAQVKELVPVYSRYVRR